MYHIMKMSDQLYAVEVSSLDNDEQIERIETFAREGTPVLIVEDLEDADAFDIDIDDIIIAELD